MKNANRNMDKRRNKGKMIYKGQETREMSEKTRKDNQLIPVTVTNITITNYSVQQ